MMVKFEADCLGLLGLGGGEESIYKLLREVESLFPEDVEKFVRSLMRARKKKRCKVYS